jgi:hypothetical protein
MAGLSTNRIGLYSKVFVILVAIITLFLFHNSNKVRENTSTGKLNLCYEHFPKSGGTFTRNALNLLKLNFTLSDEISHNCIQNKVAKNYFIISNIREPCSYYTSLWSYGCQKGGAFKNSFFRNPDFASFGHYFYQDSTNQTIFSEWLKFISQNYAGIYSQRLLFKYAGARGNGGNIQKSLTRSKQDDAGLALHIENNVDCWVHTENLQNDLKHCIKEFIQKSGSYEISDEEFERVFGLSKHNPSNHKPCDYYWNEDLKTLLLEKDGAVISALNLTCCGQTFEF